MKLFITFLCLCALLMHQAGQAACAQSAASKRIAVSILWFENKTGDARQGFLRYMVEQRISQQLTEVHAVRLTGGEAFAARQLNIGGAPLTVVQARKIGEVVEAQRVIFGTYSRHGAAWNLSARVVNVATGISSPVVTGSGPDFFAACDILDDRLFEKIGIQPSLAERAKIRKRPTTSSQSAELLSQALAVQEEQRPLLEAQAFLKKAVELDPRYAEGYNALAATYITLGDFTNAEVSVRKAIELEPTYAGAHLTLGINLLLTGKYDEAEKELKEAHRLNPDDSVSEERLGELAATQDKLDDAITHFREAVRLDPFDSSVHAILGRVLATKGDQKNALEELSEADRLDPDDIGTLQMEFAAYDTLNNTTRAIETGDRFLAAMQKTGGNNAVLTRLKDRLHYLKETLTPTLLDLPLPRTYTPRELQEALESKLTAEEMKQVVNPIAEAPGMKAWAEELTRDQHTDLDKARALFDGLARRPDGNKKGGARTAQEVFALWKKPDESFNCQEYAKLYIALARTIGLKAFYVHLERDFQNRVVYHDCAVVYIGDKAVLVDLAYVWFGPSHKEHRVLDDVQAIAHQLYQSNGKNEVARCRIAVKLYPDFAWGMLSMTGALIGEGKWDEARKTLESADRLEPNRWGSAQLHGILAFHNEKWDIAQGCFKQALAANPNDPISYYYLGTLDLRDNNLSAARDAFRTSLRLDPPQDFKERADLFIAGINEQLAPVSPKK